MSIFMHFNIKEKLFYPHQNKFSFSTKSAPQVKSQLKLFWLKPELYQDLVYFLKIL